MWEMFLADPVLKFLSHPTKRCNRSTLLHLYISLIRSIIHYGAPVYSLTNQSFLTLLDSVQNTCLRLALGAFRSSPALSLCAEAGLPPLSFRRYTLFVKLLIFEPDSFSISNSKAYHHIKIKLEKFLNTNLSYNLLPTIISNIPFWLQVQKSLSSGSQVT